MRSSFHNWYGNDDWKEQAYTEYDWKLACRNTPGWWDAETNAPIYWKYAMFEPIEWVVLDVKDGKAFVISKYVLDKKRFYTRDEYIANDNVFWEDCIARDWLNSVFYTEAFTAEEAHSVNGGGE